MSEIRKRIFVVGCSRSGTTMLQVLLASHPDVKSFPETNFFWSATGDRRRILARFGLPTGLEAKAIRHTIGLLNSKPLEHSTPRFFISFRSAVAKYISLLDAQAAKDEKSMWLEKTPLHVCRIRFIEEYVKSPLFVHMIRDGRDVVASICDRAVKYPERFGWQRNPSYGINLWNRTIAESLKRIGHSRHVFTTYNRITQDTEKEVRRLCNELDISFHYSMVKGDKETQTCVVPKDRPWIHGAKHRPVSRKRSKFQSMFDSEDRDRISRELKIQMYHDIIDNIV